MFDARRWASSSPPSRTAVRVDGIPTSPTSQRDPLARALFFSCVQTLVCALAASALASLRAMRTRRAHHRQSGLRDAPGHLRAFGVRCGCVGTISGELSPHASAHFLLPQPSISIRTGSARSVLADALGGFEQVRHADAATIRPGKTEPLCSMRHTSADSKHCLQACHCNARSRPRSSTGRTGRRPAYPCLIATTIGSWMVPPVLE